MGGHSLLNIFAVILMSGVARIGSFSVPIKKIKEGDSGGWKAPGERKQCVYTESDLGNKMTTIAKLANTLLL